VLTKNQDKVLVSLVGLEPFSFSALCDAVHLPTDKVTEVLEELFDLDYLEHLAFNHLHQVTCASLSVLGKYYLEHKRLARRRMVVAQIISYLAGIATSVIASYIYGWLS